MSPASLWKRAERINGKREAIEAERVRLSRDFRTEAMEKRRIDDARSLVIKVSEIAMGEVVQAINEIVTACLTAIYGDGVSFDLSVVSQKNRADFVSSVVENGKAKNPRLEVGGGVLNSCGFGARIALMTMCSHEVSPTLILDEPFRFLGALRPLGAEILKEVSENLGVQVIVLTHDEEIADIADTVYLVEKKDGVSEVSEI